MYPTNIKTSEQPVALVTGSARRIGASINQLLHQRHCRVAIHCHSSTEAANQLADTLNRQRPNSAMVLSADLSDNDAPERVVKQVLDKFGRVDLLVNNASAFYPTAIGNTAQEDWDILFASNARAPFFLSQAAAPALRQSNGSIISILDIHIDAPLREHTIYCMAKAAQLTMVKSLAKELAPDIRVNGVAPGAILWPEATLDETAKRSILERVPLQRAGEPEDIAGAVVFLAMDAPYITGQVLSVDGGRSLHR